MPLSIPKNKDDQGDLRYDHGQVPRYSGFPERHRGGRLQGNVNFVVGERVRPRHHRLHVDNDATFCWYG